MTLLNEAAGAAVGALLWPFAHLAPLLGLAAVSVVTAVGLLLAFKRFSRQRRIADVKRQMQAAVFEIRLFADDLPAIARAQLEILGCNVRYLGLSLVPVLWVSAPLALLLAQLHMHYGYRSPDLGEPIVVTVELRDTGVDRASATSAPGGRPAIRLDAPDGIRVDTPPLWIPSRREVSWRIAAERPGAHELTVRLGEDVVAKTLHVSDQVVARSPRRVARGILSQFLYPTERPLPDTVPIDAIEVTYPSRGITVFTWDLPWIVVFFVLTMVFALALRKRFGVVL